MTGITFALPTAIATAVYHTPSIIPAVKPMIHISAQLEFVSTKWLNMAKKNSAIFGFIKEMTKPSNAALPRFVWGDPESAVFSDCVLGFVLYVRYPTYKISHAPMT